MNTEPPHRILLSSEPAFRLGGWAVEPALRQMSNAGESRTIEPRVMQVLVALAKARDRVIGRDALVDSCWSGRIVGETAINRVISLLRTLGAETDAFEIETITKVGYRLKAAEAASPEPRWARRTSSRQDHLKSAGGQPHSICIPTPLRPVGV